MHPICYLLTPDLAHIAPHMERRRSISDMFALHSATIAALLLPAIMGCAPKEKAPAPAGQASMAGMSTSAPVTIPQGAIFTAADVHFMQGMIAHHAQAIYMSHMAAGHGANPRLVKFAGKIDQSQVAEIRLMQDWLRRNGQSAPDTSSWHKMQMPGMLTADQIKSLDAAKGPDFDRVFLNDMIQHHEGALQMVSDLFATPLAGQDVDVSVFANDVQTVQSAEIAIMHRMLGQVGN